jgi:F-type H+-transporting ATPase subunit delta
MADYQAAKRYAQAVFAIATDANTVDQWRADLNDVATVLVESPLAAMLQDDRVTVERRQALVERSLDVSPLALNLAKLLVAKGRAADARLVADAFNEMADEAAGIVHAHLTTAIELSPDQVQGLQARLGSALGKNVQATASVDPSLLGGIVIRVGDRLIDGSVRTRLKELRRELEGAH